MFSNSIELSENDSRCSKCTIPQREPVLLSCGHRYCLACIDEIISAKSLNCPLCHKTFDSWIRLRRNCKPATNISKRATAFEISLAENEKNADESQWNSIKKRFNDLLIKRSIGEQSTSKINCSLSRQPISAGADVLVKRKLGIDKHTSDFNTLFDRDGTADSINREMTHFRPICLMPPSIRNATEKIVKVLPVRQRNIKIDLTKTYKPAKSKFKQKLTSIHRRSAFRIFQPLPSTSAAQIALALNTTSNRSTVVTSGKERAQLSTCKDEELENKLFGSCKNPSPISNSTTRSKRKQNAINSQNSHTIVESESAATSRPAIVTRNKMNLRDKVRLQEKEDYRLAKMLQEYDDNARSTSTSRGSRYSLRSRSKPSISSLSSSSSVESKLCLLTLKSDKKNGQTLTRSQRTVANKEPIAELNEQKLTRSRRLALTLSGA